ncbi:Elongation of very long chain fatty acids protein 6 [Halotydeus destructor]|nr:Elongation of very long chain fatty acids protein 6 [Halotydeus destructor]
MDFIFNLEKNFDATHHQEWFKRNLLIPVILSAIYVTLVFSGRNLMKSRAAFNLRSPLTIWSFSLAIYSLIVSLRVIPRLADGVRRNGFQGSVCLLHVTDDKLAEFWIWTFSISKAFELIDTAFIVLRKQKLIFLHWYHHFVTLIYCWFSFSTMSAMFIWFMAMNAFVHTVMYTYYGLRALRIRVPSYVNIIITSVQILQMIVGSCICVLAVVTKTSGRRCDNHWTSVIAGTAMYFSYLYLFGKFFVDTYLLKPSSTHELKRQ